MSVPLTTLITYLYYGQFTKAIKFVIVVNIVMTISHFLHEKTWPYIWKKIKT